MSEFWNRRTKNLSPYIPGEQPRDRRFVKLNTNENPYPPSPKAIDAIAKAANGDLRLYPDPACTAFRDAVAERHGVRREQVFAGNGSDEVLGFAFGAFFGSSADGAPPVLFPDITYSFYSVYAKLWDVPYRTVPLDDGFAITVADYMPTSGGVPPGGVVFPNPNAPTGMALPPEQVLSLAECLERHGKVLILDEAYIEFGGGGASAVGRIDGHRNLLVVHTLSKSASLAGLRVGYAIGSEPLIEGLCRIRDSFNSYTLDRLALAGAAAAVLDTEYYDMVNRKVIATRERVTRALLDFGFTVLPSAANFVFAKAPGIGGADFFAALRRRGILVRHFDRDRIADFLRISIGTDDEMDEFLDAAKAVLENPGLDGSGK